VLSVTEDEARQRAGLLADIAYDVVLDLACAPARSRTRVTFRCRRPGAETFAQLAVCAGPYRKVWAGRGGRQGRRARRD
jgi:hypothetical protein